MSVFRLLGCDVAELYWKLMHNQMNTLLSVASVCTQCPFLNRLSAVINHFAIESYSNEFAMPVPCI